MGAPNLPADVKSSGFFNKLKGMVFEPEATTLVSHLPQATPVATTAPATGTTPTGEKPGATSSAPFPSLGNAMTDKLQGFVMDKQTAYTALVEAITPLETFIVDEGQRYRAAFAIVGKSRTVDQIVQAIDMQHVPVIDAEVQRFNAQAESKEEREIGAVTRDVAAKRKSRDDYEAEASRVQREAEARVTELTQQSLAAETAALALEQQIAAKRADLDSSVAQFNEAVTQVRARMAQTRANVLAYLKTA